MSKTNYIGVIGLGDLGAQLSAQIIGAKLSVLAYNRSPDREIQLNQDMLEKPVFYANIEKYFSLATMEEIFAKCDIIHFAIPADAIAHFPALRKNQIGVLHDSVMTSSLEAAEQRADKDQFVIVHCLMNSIGRVFIARDFGTKGNLDTIREHFLSLHLKPKFTTVADQDQLMAKSQTLALLLIQSGIHKELKQEYLNHDLTPSGEEVLRLLNNRQLHWSPKTIASLLKNPYLRTQICEEKPSVKQFFT